MSDIPADGRSIEFQPTARRARPVARRIGWILVAVTSLLIGAYAVFLIATGFAFVPAEVPRVPRTSCPVRRLGRRGSRPNHVRRI
jgi:hypothetical protein